MFAFELGGHVFTELEVIGLSDCWGHCSHCYTWNLKSLHPLFKMQLTKYLFFSGTNNLPAIYLNLLVNYQFVFRLTPLANGFGGRPESDFLLTLSNGLSTYTLWMQTNWTQPVPPLLLEPFSIHWFLSLLLANDSPLFLCMLLNLLNSLYCRLQKEDLGCIWSTEILFDCPVIKSWRAMHPRWAVSLSLFICMYECLSFHLRGEWGGFVSFHPRFEY